MNTTLHATSTLFLLLEIKSHHLTSSNSNCSGELQREALWFHSYFLILNEVLSSPRCSKYQNRLKVPFDIPIILQATWKMLVFFFETLS